MFPQTFARICALALLTTTSAFAFEAANPAQGRSPQTRSPQQAEILAVMERVADWQLANPSKHPTDDWTQAAFYTGMMALTEITQSPRFFDAMMAMGEKNQWRLGQRRYHADDHCVGQTYVELFLVKKDPRMIAHLQSEFDAIMANPKDDDLDFEKPNSLDKWVWCDALFMSPPAWARLHFITGKQAYLDYMIEHWWKVSDYLYDKEEHLYLRDSRYFTRREANGRKVFWSRGNGWVLAGLARTLQYLPLAHPARPRFEQQFKEMAAKILSVQQEDGLWRASLLDPASYPMKESSGSGFFCYGLAWGVNNGYLDRQTYAPKILKTWNALTHCVNAEGKLTHVQPIGFTPKTFDPELTEVYGVGAFLLAGSEVYRLVGASH
jgi:unsaturated rhamnogalacturonyl hydrolase